MAGLLVLFLFGLYIWGSRKLVRQVKPLWGKVIVVLVLLLIPTADAIYGRIKLRQMCEAEGGLKVYRVVEGVDGFYTTGEPDEVWVTKYGFSFAEGEGLLDGKWVTDRLFLQADGRVRIEKNVQQKSKYKFSFQPGRLSDRYMRSEYLIETAGGNEVLGRIANFSYAGGWVERAIAGLVAARGSAGNCNLNPNKYELGNSLVLATLKPNRAPQPGSEK